MNVRVGPAQILIAVGLTGLVWFEWRTWKKNR